MHGQRQAHPIVEFAVARGRPADRRGRGGASGIRLRPILMIFAFIPGGLPAIATGAWRRPAPWARRWRAACSPRRSFPFSSSGALRRIRTLAPGKVRHHGDDARQRRPPRDPSCLSEVAGPARTRRARRPSRRRPLSAQTGAPLERVTFREAVRRATGNPQRGRGRLRHPARGGPARARSPSSSHALRRREHHDPGRGPRFGGNITSRARNTPSTRRPRTRSSPPSAGRGRTRPPTRWRSRRSHRRRRAARWRSRPRRPTWPSSPPSAIAKLRCATGIRPAPWRTMRARAWTRAGQPAQPRPLVPGAGLIGRPVHGRSWRCSRPRKPSASPPSRKGPWRQAAIRTSTPRCRRPTTIRGSSSARTCACSRPSSRPRTAWCATTGSRGCRRARRISRRNTSLPPASSPPPRPGRPSSSSRSRSSTAPSAPPSVSSSPIGRRRRSAWTRCAWKRGPRSAWPRRVARNLRIVAASRESAANAIEALRITEIAYKAGATTNIEVVQAQQTARNAELAASLALDRLRQAQLDLVVALGQFP